jgi:hypothetical protein
LSNADWTGKSLSKKHDSDGEDDSDDEDDDEGMSLQAGVETKDKRKPHSKLVDLNDNGRHPARQQMVDESSRETDEDQVTDLVFSDDDDE